jgi:phosphoenolpyruvate carboxylase
MTGAVIEATLAGRSAPSDPSYLEAMRLCADESRAVFRALVYDDPDLETYFRASTPIDVIERLAIGSRPSARAGQAGLRSLRAIPWTFAWMQSRQLITGWYGVGAGLAAVAQRFGRDHLARMARSWPFFQNLLSDVEMVLAKADMPIAAHYAALAEESGRRIFPRILAEFERTRALVCEAQGVVELLDRERTLQRAIRLRNPYVDPMSLVQVDFLERWRRTGRSDPALERVLLTTVRGIARGLQNTG